MGPPRFRALLLALLLTACAGGDGREVLTVYSPHGRDLLQAFEQRYEAANPGVDVQMVDMGSQEVLDRIRSERANPQADVWFGAPSPIFAQAAADSLLAPSAPTWAAQLSREARDPGGRWYGTYLTPEVIAYNARAVPAAEAPRDWDDLLDPRWRGKILIRDPMASGTMRTIFAMILQRSLRATGDTARGFAWLRRLDAQTKEYVLNPTLLYQKLARQEGLVTVWDLPDIEQVRARGLPIGYTFPSSGTPVVIDAVAVVRNAPNAKRAREFVEFIGSAPEVALAARRFYRLPARTDLPDSALSAPLRAARAALRPEPMDWTSFQNNGAAWMRWWDEHVRTAR